MENLGQETHSTKMGADKSSKNTPIAPKFICPICLSKSKKFENSTKKASVGVRSPWGKPYIKLSKPNTNKDV